MTSRTRQSERTCCGTRATHPEGELLRWFLGPDSTPWPDVSRRAGGRGAWTLPTSAAVESAATRGGFARAFQCKVARVAPELLVERAAERVTKWWYNRMGLANRAGALAVGQASAREAFRDGRAALLIMAQDAGSAAQQKFGAQAERKRVPLVVARSGASVGASLGREFVSVTAVCPSAFAVDLERTARWIVSLGGTEMVSVSPAPAPASVVRESASREEASPPGPERAPHGGC